MRQYRGGYATDDDFGAMEQLFSTTSLRDVLDRAERHMYERIDGCDSNRLLQTSVDDLATFFAETYQFDPPRLRETEIAVDRREVPIDVSKEWERAVSDRSRPFSIAGAEFLLEVPFDGDHELFRCSPSTISMSPPRGSVRDGIVVLSHRSASPDPTRVRAELDRTLHSIRQYLSWMQRDVEQFNGSLFDRAKERIEARRQRILRDQGVTAALGYPLKQRPDAPTTYAAPQVRRAIKPRPPAASTAPFTPEPVLADADYEHILTIISRMATVLERSPKAFRHMGEEQLRDHFLVQLNGQYEGQATGETFNFEGKTDILIRVEGRNIFIGECKFWRGPQGLTRTVDQLLGYATWRDTKVAIILFNRSKNFSAVLQKIRETMRSHPNVKRERSYPSETGFRYVVLHRDDPSRELILTVLAFEVPGESEDWDSRESK
jgi:hypothetical protein